MMSHVRTTAEQIASKSPLTVRGIKRVALYTRDHPTARRSQPSGTGERSDAAQ